MVEEEREEEGEEKGEEKEDDSEKIVAETEETEAKIDNNPDKVDFGDIKDKIANNPWMIATVVLGVAVLILLFMNFRGGITGNVVAGDVVSGDVAGNNLVDYLNTRSEEGVEYLFYEDLGSNLYAITVEYQENEIPVFVTKDGEYFVQGAIPIGGQIVSLSDFQDSQQQLFQESPQENQSSQQQTTSSVEINDVNVEDDVELDE